MFQGGGRRRSSRVNSIARLQESLLKRNTGIHDRHACNSSPEGISGVLRAHAMTLGESYRFPCKPYCVTIKQCIKNTQFS